MKLSRAMQVYERALVKKNLAQCRPSVSEATVFLRPFGSSLNSTDSIQIQVPAPKLKSWENGAARVKDPKEKNQYMETIRATHDPGLAIKSLEDELKSTIGQALGKQGQKITNAIQLMQQEYERYQSLLDKHGSVSHCEVMESAKQFNHLRQKALTARWELMVHRHAVGFVVDNHKLVMEIFPVSDALPVGDKAAASRERKGGGTETKQQVIGDQLDWWQRVGRWK